MFYFKFNAKLNEFSLNFKKRQVQAKKNRRIVKRKVYMWHSWANGKEGDQDWASSPKKKVSFVLFLFSYNF